MAQQALVDGLGWEIHPTSEQELLQGLQQLDDRARAASHPRMAQLFASVDDEDPPGLAIGVGAEESVLVYTPSELDNGEGAYSVGPYQGDEGEVWFAYGDTDSGYQRWMLIPKAAAFAAAAEFYRTGRRPANVEWEAV